MVRGLGPPPWHRRYLAAAIVLAVAHIEGTTVVRRWVFAGGGVPERVVENVGGFDPVTEGHGETQVRLVP